MKLCTDRRTQPEAFQVQGTISTSNAQILIPGHKTRTAPRAALKRSRPRLVASWPSRQKLQKPGIRCCCWWWWEPSATPPGRKAIAAYREILARPFFFFRWDWLRWAKNCARLILSVSNYQSLRAGKIKPGGQCCSKGGWVRVVTGGQPLSNRLIPC